MLHILVTIYQGHITFRSHSATIILCRGVWLYRCKSQSFYEDSYRLTILVSLIRHLLSYQSEGHWTFFCVTTTCEGYHAMPSCSPRPCPNGLILRYYCVTLSHSFFITDTSFYLQIGTVVYTCEVSCQP